jgi:hypothetical protein
MWVCPAEQVASDDPVFQLVDNDPAPGGRKISGRSENTSPSPSYKPDLESK